MGILSRLFGKKKKKTSSMEDRLAEASIKERQAFDNARRAEATLVKAVNDYKEARKRGASEVELMGLRDKVERANDAYDARVQMLRNCSTNVSLISQVENNELLKAAAAITVSDDELEDSTKEAALRIEEQRQAKLAAEQHKNILREAYEMKSRSVDDLLGENEEAMEMTGVQEEEKDASGRLTLD